MAKGTEKARAKALEAKLLEKYHDPTSKDNSLKARSLRGLQLGSIRATERLLSLLDSQDERVAFGAAREVLQRVHGMPKASVDVSVSDTSAAHHAALKAIYDKALARLDAKASPIDPDAIDAQVVVDAPAQLESDSATGQIEQGENEA